MTREISILRVSGTSRQCGEQVGSALRDEIRANVSTYAEIIQSRTGAGREEIRSYARRITPHIEAYAPELMEEICGMADGAGAALEDLIALNARTELMYGLKARKDAGSDSECTSLGALPEVTGANHTIIGENWDWKAAVADRTVVLAIEKPGFPRCLVFTEAGFVGKIGLNQHGIGVCANLLTSSHDGEQMGVPFHVILRKMLEAPNLHKAVIAVTRAQRGSSGNYLIGAKGGEILDIEATPLALEQILPRDGIISHANHFASPALAPFDTHKNESTLTVIREARSDRLLRKQAGNIAVETFIEIFRDHFSRPHSICRHVDESQAPLEQSVTGASIVMDLDMGEMHIAAGPPCENDFKVFRICSAFDGG